MSTTTIKVSAQCCTFEQAELLTDKLEMGCDNHYLNKDILRLEVESGFTHVFTDFNGKFLGMAMFYKGQFNVVTAIASKCAESAIELADEIKESVLLLGDKS